MVYPWGDIKIKKGGVPSGSGLTSLIDTIISGILIEEFKLYYQTLEGSKKIVFSHAETGDNLLIGINTMDGY
jgi:hypothetical protein